MEILLFWNNTVNTVGTSLHTNLVKLNSPLLGFYPTGFWHSLHFLLQHVRRYILPCINSRILITLSYLKAPQISLTDKNFLTAKKVLAVKNFLTALLMNMLEYNVIIYGYGLYLHWTFTLQTKIFHDWFPLNYIIYCNFSYGGHNINSGPCFLK